MKKAIAMLLAVAMTAALAIGGTLAYLTDTDEDVNVMTLGQVKIDQLEYERKDVETENEDADVQEFHDNKPLLPAVTEDGFNYVPGDSYVNWDQIGKDGYTSNIWDPEKINNEVDKMVFVKNKGDWDAYVRTVFAFEAGSYTTLDEFNAKMHLNLNTTDFTWEWVEAPMKIGEGTYFVAVATYNKVLTPGALTEISLSQIALDKTATNDDVAGFGDTFQVLVQSQAVQAAGFDDAATALNEAFGIIPPPPFADDEATKGTDVFTALNYLNGGTEKITTKVSNVVFGLTDEYADIALQNKGTLVDVEQDVPVYAYYVPNGGNYDVYLLASDTIYAPRDCTSLFEGMTALTAVDTDNFDVSRTETMYRMFKNCKNLVTLDVSQWDTGNVTDMYEMFRSCEKVTPLDVSDWDVSNVTTLQNTFAYTYALTELDVSDWDVSKVENMAAMFYHCENITELDLDDWDVSNVTTLKNMFSSCYSLTNVNLANWNTKNVTTCAQMFFQCKNLKAFDASNWDVSNLDTVKDMFAWCALLEVADVSGWDTSNVTVMESMFTQCYELKTVYVSNLWDMSAVTNSADMFFKCSSLVGGNGTVFDASVDDGTYACIDTEQTPGYFTYKAAPNT